MRSGLFFQKEPISVPSVPSPPIGAVHIMRAERVRPIDTSFSQAVRELSRRRGAGAKHLVTAAQL